MSSRTERLALASSCLPLLINDWEDDYDYSDQATLMVAMVESSVISLSF